MSESTERVIIGPYAPGDEEEILRVFQKVFQVARSPDAWRWQYAENPAGLHCFLARTEAGRVVSQFTGVPRRVRTPSGEAVFSEIVDSFTDPDYRQGLKKPGWFASTCYAFVDHFGRPDRESIMYGLPNPMAYRVGSRLLGYEHFYKVELLTRKLDGSEDLEAPEGGIRAIEADTFGPEWDGFFESRASRFGALTVRDSRYLNWRYGARPDARYERVAFLAGDGGPAGFAVLRHRWLGNPATACAEAFLDPADPSTPACLRHLEWRARRAGSEKMQLMAAPDSPEWQGLVAMGYEPELSQFRLVARTYDRIRLPLAWLKANWYLTLGDFDIV